MLERIDVIMPFHSVDALLSAAINSVIESKYVEVRIVAVNDVNPRRQIEKAQLGLRETDILVQCDGTGYTDAMATGVRATTSQFVGFQDSDDLTNADRFYTQLTALRNSQADLVTCAITKFVISPEQGNSHSLLGYIPGSLSPKIRLLFGAHGADSTMLCDGNILRRIWNSHGQFASSIADYAWLLGNAPALKLHHVDKPLYYYRIHPGQLSSSRGLQESWQEVFPIWLRFVHSMSDLLPNFSRIHHSATSSLAITFPSALPKLDSPTLRLLLKSRNALMDDLNFLPKRDRNAILLTLNRRILIVSRFRCLRLWLYVPKLLIDFFAENARGLRMRINR